MHYNCGLILQNYHRIALFDTTQYGSHLMSTENEVVGKKDMIRWCKNLGPRWNVNMFIQHFATKIFHGCFFLKIGVHKSEKWIPGLATYLGSLSSKVHRKITCDPKDHWTLKTGVISRTLPLRHTGSFTLPLEGPRSLGDFLKFTTRISMVFWQVLVQRFSGKSWTSSKGDGFPPPAWHMLGKSENPKMFSFGKIKDFYTFGLPRCVSCLCGFIPP